MLILNQEFIAAIQVLDMQELPNYGAFFIYTFMMLLNLGKFFPCLQSSGGILNL